MFFAKLMERLLDRHPRIARFNFSDRLSDGIKIVLFIRECAHRIAQHVICGGVFAAGNPCGHMLLHIRWKLS